MSRPANSHDAMTPKNSGVEFARSADDFPVARIGDITLAMLSLVDGGGFLASAWCVSRPLAEMTRADFFGHEGRLDDEAAFRDRVFETAEHRRELAALPVSKRGSPAAPHGAPRKWRRFMPRA